jgi:hypothetical protein
VCRCYPLVGFREYTPLMTLFGEKRYTIKNTSRDNLNYFIRFRIPQTTEVGPAQAEIQQIPDF